MQGQNAIRGTSEKGMCMMHISFFVFVYWGCLNGIVKINCRGNENEWIVWIQRRNPDGTSSTGSWSSAGGLDPKGDGQDHEQDLCQKDCFWFWEYGVYGQFRYRTDYGAIQGAGDGAEVNHGSQCRQSYWQAAPFIRSPQIYGDSEGRGRRRRLWKKQMK